ncbi:RNA polymerase sigma factor, partial [Enterobacter hormaechei]|uniref:RNA polymerase sigma factor n=3 Tax=Gammaproteobacteria TaxID=1236 RepID=UPI00203CB427
AIIDGSQVAFSQLVETHQRTCAHVIGRMVGDRDQVADLLQENFLAVFRQLHRFRFECSLRTWVSRVAYTTALQHLRRRRLEAQ